MNRVIKCVWIETVWITVLHLSMANNLTYHALLLDFSGLYVSSLSCFTIGLIVLVQISRRRKYLSEFFNMHPFESGRRISSFLPQQITKWSVVGCQKKIMKYVTSGYTPYEVAFCWLEKYTGTNVFCFSFVKYNKYLSQFYYYGKTKNGLENERDYKWLLLLTMNISSVFQVSTQW